MLLTAPTLQVMCGNTIVFILVCICKQMLELQDDGTLCSRFFMQSITLNQPLVLWSQILPVPWIQEAAVLSCFPSPPASPRPTRVS